MFRSRIVAVTVTVALGGLSRVPSHAAASPYLVDFAARSDPPAGYAPADAQEVIVESAPMTGAPPASTAPKIVIETPAAQVSVSAAANAPGPFRATILVGAAPPVPRSPAVATPPAPDGGLGLMITGFSMFTASYLLTAWAGALVYDGHGGCNGTPRQCREIGKALMIPFVGPILAVQETQGARDVVSLFVASGVQIATFTMGLVGAVRQSRHQRWERRPGGVAVVPMPRLDGGGVGVNYRF